MSLFLYQCWIRTMSLPSQCGKSDDGLDPALYSYTLQCCWRCVLGAWLLHVTPKTKFFYCCSFPWQSKWIPFPWQSKWIPAWPGGNCIHHFWPSWTVSVKQSTPSWPAVLEIKSFDYNDNDLSFIGPLWSKWFLNYLINFHMQAKNMESWCPFLLLHH